MREWYTWSLRWNNVSSRVGESPVEMQTGHSPCWGWTMLRLPIMWDPLPLAHLPMATCPPPLIASSKFPQPATGLALPESNIFTFSRQTLTRHSSHTAIQPLFIFGLEEGGGSGLILSFWSIPALQSVFLHTWRGKDILTRPLVAQRTRGVTAHNHCCKTGRKKSSVVATRGGGRKCWKSWIKSPTDNRSLHILLYLCNNLVLLYLWPTLTSYTAEAEV